MRRVSLRPATLSIACVTAMLACSVTACRAEAGDRPIRGAIRSMLGKDNNAAQQSAGGLQEVAIKYRGTERSYFVHVPAPLQGRSSLHAVIVLHGGMGDGKKAEQATNMSAKADADGFVVIYPNSSDTQWNDGRATTASGPDDVGYIRAVIADAAQRFGINTQRVFVSGMSNGGMMVQKLICDGADMFMGGAVVIAGMPADLEPRCHPSRVVPLIFFTGMDDPLMPYEGGEIKSSWLAGAGGKVISHEDTIQFWSRANQCQQVSERRQLPDTENDGTTVSGRLYFNCAQNARIADYNVAGGGHTWPGMAGEGRRLTGAISKDVDASAMIVDFFQGFGL